LEATLHGRSLPSWYLRLPLSAELTEAVTHLREGGPTSLDKTKLPGFVLELANIVNNSSQFNKVANNKELQAQVELTEKLINNFEPFRDHNDGYQMLFLFSMRNFVYRQILSCILEPSKLENVRRIWLQNELEYVLADPQSPDEIAHEKEKFINSILRLPDCDRYLNDDVKKRLKRLVQIPFDQIIVETIIDMCLNGKTSSHVLSSVMENVVSFRKITEALNPLPSSIVSKEQLDSTSEYLKNILQKSTTLSEEDIEFLDVFCNSLGKQNPFFQIAPADFKIAARMRIHSLILQHSVLNESQIEREYASKFIEVSNYHNDYFRPAEPLQYVQPTLLSEFPLIHKALRANPHFVGSHYLNRLFPISDKYAFDSVVRRTGMLIGVAAFSGFMSSLYFIDWWNANFTVILDDYYLQKENKNFAHYPMYDDYLKSSKMHHQKRLHSSFFDE